jgi:hypothetical protein
VFDGSNFRCKLPVEKETNTAKLTLERKGISKMSAACYLTHFVDQNINRRGKLTVVKRKMGTWKCFAIEMDDERKVIK